MMRRMRFFGLEEANRLVPFLAETFDRVRPWLLEARDLQAQIDKLGDSPDDQASAESLSQQLDELIERIRTELQKVEELGIEVKAPDGLVDFHSHYQDREVFLCWRHGEQRIAHWHELDTGYSGRLPVADPEEFSASYLM